MPLPSAAKDQVEKKLDAFIAKRMKPHVADKIRLSYTFRGNSVTLWENRAPWTASMTTWTTSAVAQLRYDPKAGAWMLYCRDRNERWHEDENLTPVKNLDSILAELDRDPTGIYWG
jgi:hypothetical protein